MVSENLRDKSLLLLGVVALAATVVGALAVIARYSSSAALSFSDEVVTYLIVWGTLLAFGLGEVSNEHLRATVLLDRLSRNWQNALWWLTAVLTLLFAATLVYFGVDIAWHRYLLNEVSPTALRFPQWIARAAVPVGFAIVCLAILVRVKRNKDEGAK